MSEQCEGPNLGSESEQQLSHEVLCEEEPVDATVMTTKRGEGSCPGAVEATIEEGNLFQQLNMPWSIYATSGLVKAVIGALGERVPKEDTLFGAIMKFVFCIWPEPWKTQTAKDFELVIVWSNLENFLIWRGERQDWRRESVDKIDGTREGICPICFWH
ncbi:unnamed protein product [Microthlaspi erraticum]|uniref:Uncharacterized protein n=1 Tax=Microthlaspi erraticum TaxID=1685480 RepID=A0A6D2INN6_9BRAS|nr:unnamed protein product [Microthlaspi erraticum]